jgi:hypothetical protein
VIHDHRDPVRGFFRHLPFLVLITLGRIREA